MSVAKIIEITAESPSSFEDAIQEGIKRAEQSVDNVKGAWVAGQQVHVENGAIVGYRVDLKLTFVLND